MLQWKSKAQLKMVRVWNSAKHDKLMRLQLSRQLQASNQPQTKLHSPPVGCKKD